MNVAGKILQLCEERGVKQSHINKLIGGYRGKLTDWKNGKSSPSEVELNKISEFFGISVEFFRGGADPTPDQPSEEVTALLHSIQSLSKEEAEQVMEYIHFVKSKLKQQPRKSPPA